MKSIIVGIDGSEAAIAAALWAVADRLAQHEGEFHPFDRSGPFALAYARPEKLRS